MRLLLPFLLVFVLKNAFAQAYIPFLHPDNRWQVEREIVETIWSPDGFYEYTLQGDTLLNDTVYTKMFVHEFRGEVPDVGPAVYPQPYEPVGGYIAALLREDTTERKVYLRQLFSSEGDVLLDEEVLLYDFSLQVGEEVYDVIADNGPYIITAVTEEEWYGQSRRVWRTDGLQYVEGVGSTAGPLEGITPPISGGWTTLHRFCQGTAMDCNVQVDGMVNTRRQWNMLLTTGGFSTPNTFSRTYEYRFVDTIQRAGHVYYQLHSRQRENSLDFGPSGGAFREENSKVYQLLIDDSERLVYDFNLTVGDTFTYYFEWVSPMLLVETIDTIVLGNGKPVKRFHFTRVDENPFIDEPVTWIENIGSVVTPFRFEYELVTISDGIQRGLQCFYTDYEAEVDYPLWGPSSCYIYLVNTSEITDRPEIVLFPNPALNWVQYDPIWDNHWWVFYNILGQVELQARGDSGQLDVSRLPSGWYRYLVYDGAGGLVGKGKLVRE